MKAEDCPQRDKHTHCPKGYLPWHEWAEKKNKTHRQVRCPGCDLFVIWVPRKRKAAIHAA